MRMQRQLRAAEATTFSRAALSTEEEISMPANDFPMRFRVTHVSPKDDSRTELGEVELGAEGQLRSRQPSPGYERHLNNFIEEINAKKELNVKCPPPPGVKGENTLYVRPYVRSEPDFPQGLRDYARRYFALELAPVEDR